ncbi:Enoyl-CoA hydratase domain-containing protein 3, mitochondrial [Fulvia fulva]|uniref:Enoyl-CoA hydratase domain-containing protein 3, mitochondrial n=1 Tax=Passalora fulva TaxID=5499 RepID=A0A9Q8UQN4_PASFU|nr:Enoyl-CoA hydratase domain-containing protein 3, mitochondrial [Fulvia fulva]KAK4622216.1 Enoyl-CoA hydratase domain-containing protein 3, mitochondrial [Fulvia fulva]KAK4622509.1 Enoyl-CoA hydratase domain-containing protein 3, mitochondrial [Fulvia fulva]UJO18939.1 Enoyl-CoA hydratase domain-containing protein 3, mitochondrial [Fulvia fulva]WPV16645.1 Enoyl-CoA hydratase domain-containing protein 3, mitochondrial [Fulvia fulva]WPV30771.1 Enoyl-CoA hydratase domain-containing protein 3, mi
MSWPKLPAKAAYLALKNPQRRNALSLAGLRDLKDQLIQYNTSPRDGKLRLLPPFKPEVLNELEVATCNDSRASLSTSLCWLTEAKKWREQREGLPNVLVLRSEGPVFSSGHDLAEIRSLSRAQVKETFTLCAEVMQLIRRSPVPVVGVIQGLATAAGAQLALSTDLPIAAADTQFQLPGASIGLPCTSPATAVSRRLNAPFTYRMLALAEPHRADQLPGGAVEVVADQGALEERALQVVTKLAEQSAAQPQAFGKWAFWTQYGISGSTSAGGGGGDGYEDAVEWAGRVMALHAKSDDAHEGVASFFEKRTPQWKT